MTARVTFLGITAFWLAMNFFLWRAEYGVHGNDISVPADLVWQKILTAPDASSLSVFQHGEHTGYAEFSTGVGQQMAALDEDKVPPENLVKRAGYQIHFSGNIPIEAFTNRIKFEGRVQFTSARQWREFTFKLSSRATVIELHSIATNQIVHVKIAGADLNLERDVTFSELQNPETVIRIFAGNSADTLMNFMDLPQLAPAAEAQKISWDARRTRVKIGTEALPIYRLQTSVLGRDVVIDVSTVGDILRIELPGFTARIDEWRP